MDEEAFDDLYGEDEEIEYQIEIFDEPFFADSSGMFAILAASAQRTKSQLRSQTFLIIGLIFVFVSPVVAFASTAYTFAGYLILPTLVAALYCGFRGVAYMKNANEWNDILLAVQHEDSLIRYEGFKLLGETYLGEDGQKLVPPLSGKESLLRSKESKEKEAQQRELDSIGMAIDAYTAAAHHAKVADSPEKSEEALRVILDTIASLQLPQFSSLLPVVQIEQLEIAICLYLVVSKLEIEENTKARMNDEELEIIWKDDIPEVSSFNNAGEIDDRGDGLRQEGEPNAQRGRPPFYNYEDPDSWKPPVQKWMELRDDPYSPGHLLSRAAKSLCRQGDLSFAYTCYRKAADWFGLHTLYAEQTAAFLDAGFVAATRNDMLASERMLDACRPHLIHSPPITARRWWILDAIIGDAFDDEERRELATANAALLQEDKREYQGPISQITQRHLNETSSNEEEKRQQ